VATDASEARQPERISAQPMVWLAAGLALVVVGGLLLVRGHDLIEKQGHSNLGAIGTVVMVVGALVALVGVVALGVRIGLRERL
jgi:hypothetical protein